MKTRNKIFLVTLKSFEFHNLREFSIFTFTFINLNLVFFNNWCFNYNFFKRKFGDFSAQIGRFRKIKICRFLKNLQSAIQVIWDRNFCVDIVNIKRLFSIFNVGTFKFEDQCLISQLKISLQGMTIMGYRRGVKNNP